MPLVWDGIIIPENIANAFSFNGVSITDVFFNGVQVWNQSLFSATWSGNSIVSNQGMETSGSLFRMVNGAYAAGAWITVNSDGTFSGGPSLSNNLGYVVQADPTSVKWYFTSYTITGICTFDVSNSSWSGSSLGGFYATQGLATSGGLIRHQSTTTTGGSWISLT